MMKQKVAIFVLLLITSASKINAEEKCVYGHDLNCSSTVDCNETRSCISDYEALELYILSNQTIVNELAQVFYSTGRSPARFVKITYKFQIPLTYSNDSDRNNTFAENDTCSSTQRLYYWSTSPIYLLGPQPLMYLSLFAITIQEENLVVQLPCLQENEEKTLLSRLTYLV